MKKYFIVILAFCSLVQAGSLDGKKVFETYCWGCHHQTAMAFGPPFTQIAKKRTLEEIEAYITSPKSMYKAFGYKRTAMSQLNLTDKEKETVAKYILSFKGK
ncbi:cytochrome c [Sulfurimonas sp. HSL-1716]|uniref:c-type cytochrome n=1 Tax=Hydrocurvibacter sulfurireducens TaxID=3131937 RepID=UPI0031F92312